MTIKEIKEIDRRLSQIANAISTLEGEREGLQFARRLLTRKQPADDKEPSHTGTEEATSSATRRPVGSMVLEVIRGHPSGIKFRSISECVNKIANRQVNAKSVSSCLHTLKRRGHLNLDGELYKPMPVSLAA